MRMKMFCSLLLLGTLLVPAARTQSKNTPLKEVPAKNIPKEQPKATTLEDDIAHALRTHPDVRIAEAEMQLASARLEKVKLEIAQRVATVNRERQQAVAFIQAQRFMLESSAKQVGISKQKLELFHQSRIKGSGVTNEDISKAEAEYEAARLKVLMAEQQLESAKVQQAEIEAVYNTMVGKSKPLDQKVDLIQNVTELRLVPTLLNSNPEQHAVLLNYYLKLKQPAGSIPERIRIRLDRMITFECEDVPLEAIVLSFKEKAGLDFMVRIPKSLNTTLSFPKQELPLSAWLQLIRDDLCDGGGVAPRKFEWYIRDYGLTLSEYGRPDGAITLDEFIMMSRKSEHPAPNKTAPTK